MKKHTPQEIADFFDCWVAMDEDGEWFLHEAKPRFKDFYWGLSDAPLPCKVPVLYTGDWKDSLTGPSTEKPRLETAEASCHYGPDNPHWVEVRDYSHEAWTKRILLRTHPEHGAICVWDTCEEAYKEERAIREISWNLWREIPVTPPLRPMTREEVLLDNLNHPRRLVRLAEGGEIVLASCWRMSPEVVTKTVYADVPPGYVGDFTDLEWKKYETTVETTVEVTGEKEKRDEN